MPPAAHPGHCLSRGVVGAKLNKGSVVQGGTLAVGEGVPWGCVARSDAMPGTAALLGQG